MNIAEKDIGGAQVRRLISTFDSDGNPVVWRAGMHLNGDQVRAIRQANRAALVSSGALDVYRANPSGDPQLARENAQLKERVHELTIQCSEALLRESNVRAENEELKGALSQRPAEDEMVIEPPKRPTPDPEPEPDDPPPDEDEILAAINLMEPAQPTPAPKKAKPVRAKPKRKTR